MIFNAQSTITVISGRAKKRDLSQYNWRGINLLSVPSKVLARIILERLEKTLDERLITEQAGFCKDKSYTDHASSLNGQSNGSPPLYVTFVDFEKAFDTEWAEKSYET